MLLYSYTKMHGLLWRRGGRQSPGSCDGSRAGPAARPRSILITYDTTIRLGGSPCTPSMHTLYAHSVCIHTLHSAARIPTLVFARMPLALFESRQTRQLLHIQHPHPPFTPIIDAHHPHPLSLRCNRPCTPSTHITITPTIHVLTLFHSPVHSQASNDASTHPFRGFDVGPGLFFAHNLQNHSTAYKPVLHSPTLHTRSFLNPRPTTAPSSTPFRGFDVKLELPMHSPRTHSLHWHHCIRPTHALHPHPFPSDLRLDIAPSSTRSEASACSCTPRTHTLSHHYIRHTPVRIARFAHPSIRPSTHRLASAP